MNYLYGYLGEEPAAAPVAASNAKRLSVIEVALITSSVVSVVSLALNIWNLTRRKETSG